MSLSLVVFQILFQFMLTNHSPTTSYTVGHPCPKSIFLLKARGRDVLGAAHFGPEAGQPKGQTTAVSEARDGAANVVERISRLLAALGMGDNLEYRNTISIL